MDASLVVGVATGVAPERSFCFFNAVHELVVQVIARCFAFGHLTPGQRQILAPGRVTPIPPGWPESAGHSIAPAGSAPEAGDLAGAGRSQAGRGSCGPIGAGRIVLMALRARGRGHLRGDWEVQGTT